MVILSFITTPNIRIKMFSYKLSEVFLLKNIKKHKKQRKSDKKMSQNEPQHEFWREKARAKDSFLMR